MIFVQLPQNIGYETIAFIFVFSILGIFEAKQEGLVL